MIPSYLLRCPGERYGHLECILVPRSSSFFNLHFISLEKIEFSVASLSLCFNNEKKIEFFKLLLFMHLAVYPDYTLIGVPNLEVVGTPNLPTNKKVYLSCSESNLLNLMNTHVEYSDHPSLYNKDVKDKVMKVCKMFGNFSLSLL